MKLQDIDKIKIIKKNVILATIIKAKGSVPRNENVSMVISSSMQFGTIGGGEHRREAQVLPAVPR